MRLCWIAIWFVVIPCSSVFSNDDIGATDATEVLRRMRESLQLYEDYETVYVQVHQYFGDETGSSVVRTTTDRWRLVSKAPRYYLHWTEEYVFADGREDASDPSEIAFDGSTTRLNDRNEVGNVRDDRLVIFPCVPPHLFGLPIYGEIPIVDLVDGKRLGRGEFPEKIRDIERGEAVLTSVPPVDGLDCIGLEARLYHRSGLVKWRIWVSPDRNYLPIRSEQFEEENAEARAVCRTADWKEVEPGIWIPFSATAEFFLEGKKLAADHYEVKSYTVRPSVDASLFSDVAEPTHGPLYTLKGGKIVSTKGAPAEAQTRPVRWWGWAMGASVVGVALLVAAYVWQKGRT